MRDQWQHDGAPARFSERAIVIASRATHLDLPAMAVCLVVCSTSRDVNGGVRVAKHKGVNREQQFDSRAERRNVFADAGCDVA